MALVSLKEKEIQVNIIYFGPGRGGKTSDLAYIHRNIVNRINTEMVPIKRHGDPLIFLTSFPLISDAPTVSM